MSAQDVNLPAPVTAEEGAAKLESHAPVPVAPTSPSDSRDSPDNVPPLKEDDAMSDAGDSTNKKDKDKDAKRCKITREQLNVLMKSFEDEPLPNFEQRQAIAKSLNMTPRSVQIWFQNRRQRLKPMHPKVSTIGQAIGGGHCLTTPPTRSCAGSTLNASARPTQHQLQLQQQHNMAVQNLSMTNLAASTAHSAAMSTLAASSAAPAATSSAPPAGFESMVLGHAMRQFVSSVTYNNVPTATATEIPAGAAGTEGQPSYRLEPFAATKALLGGAQNGGAHALASALSPVADAAPGAPNAAFAGDLPRERARRTRARARCCGRLDDAACMCRQAE